MFQNDSPPMGIAALSAYLKEKKYQCRTWDLNIDFTKYYFNLLYRQANQELDTALINKFNELEYYSSEDACSYKKLMTELTILQPYDNLPDYCYINMRKFDYKDEFTVFIKKLYTNPELLFHYSHFKNQFLNQTLAFDADVFCFSISCSEQLYPAIILAHLLKASVPDFKIIFGGSYIYFLDKTITFELLKLGIVDYFVLLQGEKPLHLLLKYLEGAGKLENIPNLMYLNKESLEKTSLCEPISFNELPMADYASLNLKDYKKSKYFPLIVNTGCFWNKCAFCDFRFSHGQKYIKPELKSIDKLIREIEYLVNELGAHTIWLLSEAVLPGHIKKVCERIIQGNIKINFMIWARADDGWDLETCKLMKRAGCELVRVGVENFSQRLLDLMDKGIKRENVFKMLDNMDAAGIDFRMGFIYDFPSITEEELAENLEIVTNYKEKIYLFNVFPISVNYHSEIAKNPAKFGIELLSDTIQHQSGMDASALRFKRISGATSIDIFQYYYNKFFELRDKVIPEQLHKKNQKHLENMDNTNRSLYWLCLVEGIKTITTRCRLDENEQKSGNYYYLFYFGKKLFIELTIAEHELFNHINSFEMIKLGEIAQDFDIRDIKSLLLKLHGNDLIADLWIKDFSAF